MLRARKMKSEATVVSLKDVSATPRVKASLPRAAGLKKGAKGADVERLQDYLSAFGYTESPVLGTFGVSAKRAAAPRPRAGAFDDKTERALMRFQEFNHLPVTGVLDAATLELMTKPRCGFPDVADFTLQGNKWPTTNLTYGFQNFSGDLTPAQTRAAITQALGLWSAVTPLTFTEVPVGNNPDMVIRFAVGDHGDGSSFDGVGRVLAHGFFPPPNGGAIAGDCHFDDAETWTVNLPPSGIDLATVAAHEFGHTLGLAHSSVAGALMGPFYNGAHRNLEPDDIAGIRALYGTRVTPAGVWVSLGGVLTSDMAVGRNADGRLEIFARGLDNGLWHKWQTSAGGGWTGWASMGGVITSEPIVAQNLDGRLEVFAKGLDNGVWHQWQTTPSGGGSGWYSMGGVITSRIAVGRNADGRLELFVRGLDNGLWHKWQTAPNNGWSSGWVSRGGVITSPPVVGQNGDGRLEVFAKGLDNGVWHLWQTAPNGGWTSWASLGGVITSNIAVGRNKNGSLEIFARGLDNALWHNKWQAGAGWSSMGGIITGDPVVAQNADGRLEVFARGADNGVWHQWQTAPSGGFSGWSALGGSITSNITVGRNADGRIEVFVRGLDQGAWHRWQTAPNNGWS